MKKVLECTFFSEILKDMIFKDLYNCSFGKIFRNKEISNKTEEEALDDTLDDALDNIDVSEPKGENTNDNLLDNPDIRVKTGYSFNNNYAIGISLQGRSHIMSGTPCQDFHKFEELAPGWYLAVVSDGAGSAKEAARGSKANCELASKLICQLLKEKKWAETDYFPSEKEWYIEIRNIFEVIQALIERKSKQSEEGLESRDLNATLILMLITPKGLLTAHIGDGRMGYLSKDGCWKALMTPHKGDEASSTVFIPNNWNNQHSVPAFTMSDVFLPETCTLQEKPKVVILMSDGCENFCWKCMNYDKEKELYFDQNEPFPGFMNPLLDEMNAIQDTEDKIKRLTDIINIETVGGKKEQDDRTFLMVVFNEEQ